MKMTKQPMTTEPMYSKPLVRRLTGVKGGGRPKAMFVVQGGKGSKKGAC